MRSSKRRTSGGLSTPSPKATSVPPPSAKAGNDSLSAAAWDRSANSPDVSSNLHFAGESGGHVWNPGDNGFRVTIVSIDDDEKFGKALLWMSPAAMVAAPVAIGSLISVSVISSEGILVEESSAISSLSLHDLYVARYGVEIPRLDECGTYAALASVWPSKKLQKNEVKISRVLASTLGLLLTGSILSLKVLRKQPSTVDVVQTVSAISTGPEENAIFHDCSHLSLQTCCPSESSMSGLTSDSQTPVTLVLSSPLQLKFASPSRPPFRKNLEYLERKGAAVSESPLGGLSPTLDGSTTKTLPGNGDRVVHDSRLESQSWASIRAIFTEGNESLKSLLEVFASRWLVGRHILQGNLVQIPLLGSECAFLVTDAKTSARTADQVSHSNTEPTMQGTPEADPTMGGAFMKNVLKEVFLVSQNTKITLLTPKSIDENTEKSQGNVGRSSEKITPECSALAADINKIEYSALGGLKGQIDKLKQYVESSLLHPEDLTGYGLKPVRGVLLHGPPGTGKSSLARAAACEAGVKLFTINGPEVVSEFYGETESAIRETFVSAAKAGCSVIFIDELDAIAPARQDGSEELGQRMVAELLTLMDSAGKDDYKGVLVIGATNRIDAIDPALRRPGRFDVEIETEVPTPLDRLSILNILLRDMRHALELADVYELAGTSHGYVGADLSALCNEAAMSALRRCVHTQGTKTSAFTLLRKQFSSLRIGQETVQETLKSDKDVPGSFANPEPDEANAPEGGPPLRITREDFQVAQTKVRPSAMREVALEVPNVRWSGIGGQEEVKQKLKELVEWPQKQSTAIARMGVEPPRGILLHGPPGCSKTMMARAVATEAGLNFIAVKGPELFSKWVGESEKAVKSLFNKAKAAAPSVVFFDEIDGLAVKRGDGGDRGTSVGDRVMSQLLTEMDGLVPMKGVAVIAATNRLDIIDDALLRPGRFDRILYVGPPDEVSRKKIFDIHLRHIPCSSDVCQSSLASQTANYTGADISALCQEAALAALTEDFGAKTVRMRHFDVAVKRVKPSYDGR